MYHAPSSVLVLAHFTATVHQTAIERRKRNSIQGIHAPPLSLSFDPDTFLSACMAHFARSAKSTHFLAEREENRLKIQYYNWTPEISPLDKWQNDWIAGGVFEEGANSSRHVVCSPLPHPNHNHTPTTLSLRSVQLTQTNQQQLYSWQPRHKYRHRPLLPPAPPPPQPSNPQHHMSSGTNTNAVTTHQPHYHCHAAPAIPRRLPGQAPYPIHIFPSSLAGSEYEYIPSDTFATTIHKPYHNHYRPTPHPRRLPPSCLTPSY